MASVWSDVLTAVANKIRGLNLEWQDIVLPNIDVHVLRYPRRIGEDSNSNRRRVPCIIVSPSPVEGETVTALTNLTDDIVYPVLVTCVFPQRRSDQGLGEQDADADDEAHIGTETEWRQSIRRAFSYQALTAVTSVKMTTVSPKWPVYSYSELEEVGLVRTLLQINVLSEETRG